MFCGGLIRINRQQQVVDIHFRRLAQPQPNECKQTE